MSSQPQQQPLAAKPLTAGFSFSSAPTSQPAVNAPSFGLGMASNVQPVQPTVQTTTQQPPPPAFGSTQGSLSFGSTPVTTQASMGISFGQPSIPPATTAPPSFNFGPQNPSTASTSAPSLLSLSTVPAQSNPGIFGSATQPLFSNTITTTSAPAQQGM